MMISSVSDDIIEQVAYEIQGYDRSLMNTNFMVEMKQPTKSLGIFAASGKRKIEPIIVAPGLGGSALDAKLRDATEAPGYFCHHNSDWFRIWVCLFCYFDDNR